MDSCETSGSHTVWDPEEWIGHGKTYPADDLPEAVSLARDVFLRGIPDGQILSEDRRTLRLCDAALRLFNEFHLESEMAKLASAVEELAKLRRKRKAVSGADMVSDGE
ncbi:hypothetical protein GLOTRDRAFT_127599 [Gloeophyllum trabeum ATCC 11539]|uniref:Uncharacterized protein n=1 Tax=Gloeophyllum trabeum (strain ATCC 11539 / FP-39264 / Madison 617) TaxID=670483 RepID=S7QCX3_GLOTA|nr:uncharacterized protein GLOTRDRAFT_127599 [Gloeophyllum trabeum ATCC 11539]EPQ57233.1 hypothetical protein GLOTRDRAFT_127599 [Gloeophyllum trabeum ATCC 11539]